MAEPLLALRDVRSGYGDAVVLDDVSLEVPEHGSLAVRLLGHELLDLDRGALGERDERCARGGAFLDLQRVSSPLSTAVSDGSNAPRRRAIPFPGGL